MSAILCFPASPRLWFVADCLRLELRESFESFSEMTRADGWAVFHIEAQWSAPLSPRREGTLSDRLERIAARYARLSESTHLTVIHSGKSPRRVMAESPPAQSRRMSWDEKQRQERNRAA